MFRHSGSPADLRKKHWRRRRALLGQEVHSKGGEGYALIGRTFLGRRTPTTNHIIELHVTR